MKTYDSYVKEVELGTHRSQPYKVLINAISSSNLFLKKVKKSRGGNGGETDWAHRILQGWPRTCQELYKKGPITTEGLILEKSKLCRQWPFRLLDQSRSKNSMPGQKPEVK
ncbi:hypothetical protein (mitochondrion) [Glycine soja]|uniref:Uncharacterized protein n=2 Tax=Glycine subgen. Soja TaxID=1462606 RepID=M1FN55_SOYBN|nr:hypothetical protein I638_mgp028 [Glycine max]YP_009532854.1 hypothetical protein [Glycine soja]AFR34368.1 hypothetical protein GlmaxMp63 [Glycine max]AYD73002.1 hypothetical protein [Glycine soja]|eukprot:YP_007516912.1 hypothetical protein GlmaxMp63 (mitochondrion) [Glycine max]